MQVEGFKEYTFLEKKANFVLIDRIAPCREALRNGRTLGRGTSLPAVR